MVLWRAGRSCERYSSSNPTTVNVRNCCFGNCCFGNWCREQDLNLHAFWALEVNFVTGALAHLQLARAYAVAGDTAKAKNAYQDFFSLWKDADPDIPSCSKPRRSMRSCSESYVVLRGRRFGTPRSPTCCVVKPAVCEVLPDSVSGTRCILALCRRSAPQLLLPGAGTGTLLAFRERYLGKTTGLNCLWREQFSR
jgi:hypothetical protein